MDNEAAKEKENFKDEDSDEELWLQAMSQFDLEELVDVLEGASPQPKPRAKSPEKIEAPKVESNTLLTKFTKIRTGDPLTPI